MSHDQIQDLLEGYVDETLDRGTRRQVEAHLAGCEECRAILEGIPPVELGDVAATWETGNSCALTAGGTPWIHGSLDPELGMAYYTFGNVRSCRSSQDGELRPGENLFGNSVVAVDLKTGAYKWHFQGIRHDVWDMDNVHPPLLADVPIDGQMRKAIYYGSKSGHLFVLDRTNGKPLLPVHEVPMTMDSRQWNWETQPFPNRFLPNCLVWQALDPKNIPGDPWRGVPNYNGYQPDASGRLVYTEPNYLDVDKAFMSYPPDYGSAHRRGCMYDPHFDYPVLSTTTQNGGADWSNHGYSPRTNMVRPRARKPRRGAAMPPTSAASR